MVIICVTGSVGSGKTTLSKFISESLNFEYLDVSKFIDENSLVVDSFDKKLDTKNVDVDKLNDLLVSSFDKNKNYVVDSHLSHWLPKKVVNLCIVIKCEMKVLKQRLKKRKYSELKIRENLDAEIMDSCFIEALENGHKVVIIESTEGLDFDSILALIKEKLKL